MMHFRYMNRILTVATMVVLAVFLLFRCGETSKDSEESDAAQDQIDLTELRARGEMVSTTAQAVLLASVGKAIAEGGPENAVEYCNLQASGIMDSLSEASKASIGRISNRPRNPRNKIDGQIDVLAWNYWSGKQPGEGANDTVLVARNGTPFYYKPIRIGMETCLKCHGSRSTEISIATLNVLDSLYPADVAVNYRMGDLRGLWKIGF